ncbi:MAG: hypothetical protein KAS72_12545 [Phycisphaerales bacterium]|nr:hypothetical protein [Phycisphaerales bacterium]
MQQDRRDLPMVEGVLYEMASQGVETVILCWCDGGLLYYLVPPPGQSADDIAAAMNAPTRRQLIDG